MWQSFLVTTDLREVILFERISTSRVDEWTAVPAVYGKRCSVKKNDKFVNSWSIIDKEVDWRPVTAWCGTCKARKKNKFSFFTSSITFCLLFLLLLSRRWLRNPLHALLRQKVKFLFCPNEPGNKLMSSRISGAQILYTWYQILQQRWLITWRSQEGEGEEDERYLGAVHAVDDRWIVRSLCVGWINESMNQWIE